MKFNQTLKNEIKKDDKNMYIENDTTSIKIEREEN